jgi:hypothetical protein
MQYIKGAVDNVEDVDEANNAAEKNHSLVKRFY